MGPSNVNHGAVNLEEQIKEIDRERERGPHAGSELIASTRHKNLSEKGPGLQREKRREEQKNYKHALRKSMRRCASTAQHRTPTTTTPCMLARNYLIARTKAAGVLRPYKAIKRPGRMSYIEYVGPRSRCKIISCMHMQIRRFLPRAKRECGSKEGPVY